MISGRGIVKIVERKLFTSRVTLKRNESEQENARRYISSRTGPSEAVWWRFVLQPRMK